MSDPGRPVRLPSMMTKKEQEMATETMVEMGGEGRHEFETGDVVCWFDWDILEDDFVPDMEAGMMVPTKWTQVVRVESAMRLDTNNAEVPMSEAEVLAWAREHASDMLDHASDEACSTAEQWAEEGPR